MSRERAVEAPGVPFQSGARARAPLTPGVLLREENFPEGKGAMTLEGYREAVREAAAVLLGPLPMLLTSGLPRGQQNFPTETAR